MATSPDNWYRDNEEQIPAPGSWNDVDPNQDDDGLSPNWVIIAVVVGTVAFAVVGMWLAVYWH
jgi:hypothetical protein